MSAILKSIQEVVDGRGVFADLFVGTGAVARGFKAAGYEVAAADLLTFPYVLQRAYIQMDASPAFDGVAARLAPANRHHSLFEEEQADTPYLRVLDFLDRLPGRFGYVHRHYTEEGSRIDGQARRYYTEKNALKIDAIRGQVESWRMEGLITEDEYYLLLATLLEAMPNVANVLGTYGAYKKGIWEPRALKSLTLSPLPVTSNGRANRALCGDANVLVRDIECDVLYLDPPYNGRQYVLYYHLLETVALGDEPNVAGVTGKPVTSRPLSRYCYAAEARERLRDLVTYARCRHIFLSYSSEGLVADEDIRQILSLRGEPSPPRIIAEHRRYRSDKNREGGAAGGRKRTYAENTTVQEKLYHVAVTHDSPERELGLQESLHILNNQECHA